MLLLLVISFGPFSKPISSQAGLWKFTQVVKKAMNELT